MAAFTGPVLMVEMEGDSLAPPRAVDHLLAKLERAPVTRVALPPPDRTTHPHFAWFREPDQVVAQITGWLERATRAERPRQAGP